MQRVIGKEQLNSLSSMIVLSKDNKQEEARPVRVSVFEAAQRLQCGSGWSRSEVVFYGNVDSITRWWAL